MEQIVKLVAEKTGLSEAHAKVAVETVVSVLKDKLPAGVGGQLDGILKGGSANLGGLADALKGKLGGLLGD